MSAGPRHNFILGLLLGQGLGGPFMNGFPEDYEREETVEVNGPSPLDACYDGKPHLGVAKAHRRSRTTLQLALRMRRERP